MIIADKTRAQHLIQTLANKKDRSPKENELLQAAIQFLAGSAFMGET